MSLKRGILYTFLTQAPTLLLYLVASMLITRMLGDAGRGEYAVIQNHAALLTMLLGLNVHYGITYFGSRAGRAQAMAGVGITVLLANALLCPVLLLAIRSIPAAREVLMPASADHWLYWAYIYGYLLFAFINALGPAVFLATKRFRDINTMSIATGVLSAGSVLALWLWRDGDAAALPWVLAFTLGAQAAASLGWLAFYAWRMGGLPRPELRWKVLRPVVAFSLVGYLGILINLINYRFDVWVVNQYHGEAQLGIYAVAVGIGQLLFHVPEPMARVVQPFLFAERGSANAHRLAAVARVNFTALAGLAIVLAAAAPLLLPVLFGEVFAASALPLRLLLPGIVFIGCYKLLAQFVVQGGQQRFNLLATALGAALTIAFDFLLIPRYGIAGAAIASSLAYLAVLLVVLVAMKRRLGLGPRDLFVLRRDDLLRLTRGHFFGGGRG